MTADRDAARHRVADLEDQIQQSEALLRLHQQEAQHRPRWSKETARESPPTDPPATCPPPQIRRRHFRNNINAVPPLIIGLRDEDRGTEANELLAEACSTFPPRDIAELWQLFSQDGRKRDAQRLLLMAADAMRRSAAVLPVPDERRFAARRTASRFECLAPW